MENRAGAKRPVIIM